MSDGARTGDPEIARLLLEELRRHAPALAPGATEASLRRALHAMKGSAGVGGERPLADALGWLERRVVAGDANAVAEARVLLAEATTALAAGVPIVVSVWPEPPDGLTATSVEPALATRYAAEMHDRLERVDHALATGDDGQAAAAAFREVHAIKGAALAVSDDVTAWFCHGLEERLRGSDRSPDAARTALAELIRWRGVLAELAVAPSRALDTLRMLSRPSRRSSFAPTVHPLPVSSQRPPVDPSNDEPRSQRGAGDATLRVPTATLDRLFERVRQLEQARTQVSDGAIAVRRMAGRARHLRRNLAEALRLIGPARLWGAPAAALRLIDEVATEIGGAGEVLDREAALLRETADRVRVESAAAHGDLAAMRTTTVAWLFERVAAVVRAQARREGREVRLTIAGDETPIDRHVAEMLLDPILQLARNAIAHGLESATERALRGKSRVGSVHLSAQPRSGGLRLIVQDDGAGVNVADVRLRAVAKGTITAEMARAADDQTLLALLFVPGFTTKDSADLLAGRGVGLDLALEAVHRLGGTIRLASQAGMGLTAALDIPFEPGMVRVLWVEAAGVTYAVPAQQVRRVLLARDSDAAGARPLAACLDESGASQQRASGNGLAIELAPEREGAAASVLTVDRIGAIEEVALRGISALIATAGPYAGVIVRGNELRLCLDAHALAEMVGGFVAPAQETGDDERDGRRHACDQPRTGPPGGGIIDAPRTGAR